MKNISISFVLPCLNEEAQIEKVILSIHELSHHFQEFEIILADNGSTDRSVEIAKKLGVHVIHVPEKGYGSALRRGIENSRFDVICFGDADHTYSFSDSLELLRKISEENCSLAIGDRLNGKIEDGAMPFLHRYVGTPLLSLIVGLLFAKKQMIVKDINCGLRVFKREDFFKLSFHSNGMEFASEMVIRYLKNNLKIETAPISLRAGNKNRVPHLRPFRDGIRHLKLIMKELF